MKGNKQANKALRNREEGPSPNVLNVCVHVFFDPMPLLLRHIVEYILPPLLPCERHPQLPTVIPPPQSRLSNAVSPYAASLGWSCLLIIVLAVLLLCAITRRLLFSVLVKLSPLSVGLSR
jgi:hypothetical protein